MSRLCIEIPQIMAIICCARCIAQPCPDWTRVNSLPRSSMAMAYDSARDVIVMFGGNQNGIVTGDTLEWSGSNWIVRATAGPAPSALARMAFDAARGVCILLRGSETWEWNGVAWLLRSVAGPSPQRDSFSLCYDQARQRVTLFGGQHSTAQGIEYLQDTWTWDGANWSLAATSGPSPRSRAATAFDSARQEIVLFGGGIGSSATYNDTWTWDGVTWTPRIVAGPRARAGHAMIYSAARQAVVLFGGRVGTSYDAAVWEWNGTSWQMVPNNGCPPRESFGFVEHSERETLVCFGGYDGVSTLGDTRELAFQDGAASWSLLSDSGVPSPRRDSAMAFDGHRGVAVLFGGELAYSYAPGYFSNETWEWNGEKWLLRPVIGPWPSPRGYSAIAFDPVRHVTVLFGGYGFQGVLRDTWEWDGTAWTLRATTGPTAGFGARLVYDEARNVCVLFGGSDTTMNAVSRETWTWNGTQWTLVNNAGPTPRFWHAMAYDSDRDIVVMHGGYDNQSPSKQDTWEWNGQDWTLRSSVSGFHRYLHQIAYDPGTDTMVAFGGRVFGAPYSDDMWRWLPEPGTWVPLVAPGPSQRHTHVMVFDSWRNLMLMYGGTINTSGSAFTDTWTLNLDAPPEIATAPASTIAALGSTVSLSVGASGPGPFLFQWRRNELPLDDAGHYSGVRSPILTIAPAAIEDSGLFDVVVANDCGQIISNAATVVIVQPGDATGDGDVDVNDLLAVIAAWGPCPAPPATCSADIAPLGGDAVVDVDDLLMVVLNWGA